MLQGVIPIVLVPFDDKGRVDERSLRRVVRFELEAPIDGLGIGGFASEAYKLTDQERMHSTVKPATTVSCGTTATDRTRLTVVPTRTISN